MFVEPDEAESKIAANADPTVTARSTIRRQRTVRYSPGTRLHRQSSAQLSSRRQNAGSNSIRHPLDPRRSLLEDIRRRGASTEHHASLNEIDELEASIAQYEAVRNPNAAEVTDGQETFRSRMESESARATPTTTRTGPGSHSREGDAMSEYPFENPTSSSSRLRSSVQRYRLTPPYSQRESQRQSPVYRPVNRPRDAPYTPGFPPAHRPDLFDMELRRSERMVDLTGLAARVSDLQSVERYRHDNDLDSMLSNVNSMISRSSSRLTPEYLLTESEVVNAIKERVEVLIARAILSHDLDHIPPSRRRHHPSHPNPLSRDDLDGLGDRERSFSPEGISWETMLTNITPDDRVPSLHSSFNRATPSTSTSSFGSVSNLSASSSSSYGTQFTAPSSSAEIEPCPVMDAQNSDREYSAESSMESSHSHRPPRAGDTGHRADEHLDRIQSLSTRLDSHRAHGSEHSASNRRSLEREAELQRLEATLRRLERQIEEENHAVAGLQRTSGVRAGRERL
ncbi:uncharacterized protein KY384_006941 [Bacidia gigantensis]|uniref:uncharacterized protein n=1 Tax=Bacidia gigantensis TaxID=2732470 RepID=UPI001D038569|nr:uncharacterized protein KY384_006941 [Bacidia gigantensis]KAG8528025.1 hypothetical protein KY384_006941 [Bacidia gigantensis]